MKKHLLILISFTLFFNCTVNQKPQFVGIENIKVLPSDSKLIKLTADAHFTNPNDLGGSLKTDDLKIYINKKQVATLTSKRFDVPKRKDFTIPLNVSISTDSLINRNSLEGLLGSLISQKLEIQYKGKIDYRIMGFNASYNVDETENIKLKL